MELTVFEELRELWRIPRYRILLAARFVSNVGNGMAPIALAFGVLSLDGADAGSLSLVTTAQMIPLVTFLLVGGVAADRFGRSQLVGSTDIIGSAVVAISAIAFLTDNASVPLLCVNGFIFGVLNALWYPAFSGLMPLIVPGPLLQGANSILGFGANVGYTIGASVAGFIVATAGPGWGLLGDATSFLVAGLLVLSLRLPKSFGENTDEDRTSMITQLRVGWTEFSSRRWIVLIVGSFAFYHLAFEAFIAVLAPVHMKEEFDGARAMGTMMFGFGVGSILGTALAFRFKPHRPLLIAVGVMPIGAAWMLATGLSAPLWILFVTAMGTGVAVDVMYANWMTTLQTNVPEEALSRVGSYDAFGSLAFAPLGLLLAGPMADGIGARASLLIMGTIALVAVLTPLWSGEVRHLQRTH
ncbi:MAG: MFS transporter [Ilumatobacteraceae bacterium]|nr:MFS transporter [Ilumatobacteraceae bacterium]